MVSVMKVEEEVASIKLVGSTIAPSASGDDDDDDDDDDGGIM